MQADVVIGDVSEGVLGFGFMELSGSGGINRCALLTFEFGELVFDC